NNVASGFACASLSNGDSSNKGSLSNRRACNVARLFFSRLTESLPSQISRPRIASISDTPDESTCPGFKRDPAPVETDEQFFLPGVSESTGCNCDPVKGSDRARMGEHHQNQCPMRCSCLDVRNFIVRDFIRCPFHEEVGPNVPL